MSKRMTAPTSVAIAGLGSVGRVVARRLRDLPEYRLTAASARDQERAKRFLMDHAPEALVVPLGQLVDHADIVIECAPAAYFPEIAEPVIAAGKVLIPLSVGALLESWPLVEAAEKTGAQILVPTGALVGLDAVQGIAQGHVKSVRMITRKPVGGLKNAPFVVEKGIDLQNLEAPLLIFEGTAREAIVGFPANLNVAVALSLAGVGPDRTTMQVWVDPDLVHNTHRIIVESDSANLDLTISNIPSENPATGRLTALSVVALLRKMSSPLRIGT